MADPQIVNTLRTKRNDIERAIVAYEAKIEAARIDLMHVNAVLHLYEHGREPTQFPVHMGVARLFKRGELVALCLEALRGSPAGLDTRELAQHVMRAKGLDGADRVLRNTIAYSIMNAMRRQWKLNKTTSPEKRRGVRLWNLSRNSIVVSR
jgi:hypothetical protein